MQEKHTKKMTASKLIVMIVAIAIVASTVIGGTVAWLIARTEPVVNTFTYGDIDITLEEDDTGLDGDQNPNTNQYEMIPGKTIAKNPKVTFEKGSENAWLFVKLEKSANFDTFMEYEVVLDDPATAQIEGWTALPNVDGVYYIVAEKADADAVYQVLKDNQVKVKGDVTKEQLNALDANNAQNYPKLTVTAYAVQRDAAIDAIDTVEEAWALAVANTGSNNNNN